MEWIRSRQAGILGGAAGGAGVGAAAAAGGAAAAPVLQAQRCELCRERLNFRARYRPGAPSHLGVSEVRFSLQKGSRLWVQPDVQVFSKIKSDEILCFEPFSVGNPGDNVP